LLARAARPLHALTDASNRAARVAGMSALWRLLTCRPAPPDTPPPAPDVDLPWLAASSGAGGSASTAIVVAGSERTGGSGVYGPGEVALLRRVVASDLGKPIAKAIGDTGSELVRLLAIDVVRM